MLDPQQVPQLHDLLLAEDWVGAAHLLSASAAGDGRSGGGTAAGAGTAPGPQGTAVLGGVVARTRAMLPGVLQPAVDLTARVGKLLVPSSVLEGAGQAVMRASSLGILPNVLLDTKMRAERVLVANGSASGGQHGEPVNPKHDPPLCWVARKNQAHLVDLLVEGENAGLEVRHDGGATPLYLAAQEGHIEVVRRLLRHGARVDAVDTDGWVPLHAAAQNGHLTCVELLLDAHKARNVPVDVYSTQNSLTPLHLAAREGNADIVRALLRAGPDPRARTKAGATSLHLAAGHGNLDSVRALLTRIAPAAGSGVSDPTLAAYASLLDSSGSTALHYAARYHPSEAEPIAELLISSGADPSVVNSLNRTALRQAIANGHGDLVLLFLSPRGTPPRARTDSPLEPTAEDRLALAARGKDRAVAPAALARVQAEAVSALVEHAEALRRRCGEAEGNLARLVGLAEEGAAKVPEPEVANGGAELAHKAPVRVATLEDPWKSAGGEDKAANGVHPEPAPPTTPARDLRVEQLSVPMEDIVEPSSPDHCPPGPLPPLDIPIAFDRPMPLALPDDLAPALGLGSGELAAKPDVGTAPKRARRLEEEAEFQNAWK